MKKVTTLIFSDTHLGTEVSRAKELLEILKAYRFKRLILLGDIFEDLDFDDLTDDQWELISHIRILSRKTKVIWIEGNHDKGLIKMFSALFGIKVYQHYIWKHQDKKCLAIHGHQFDRFLINNVFLSNLSTWIYLLIQKIDFADRRMSRYAKRTSKGWLRLSEKVAQGAIRFGKRRNADYVFCGHTHRSMKKTKKGVRYFNSGCWTDIPSAYITLEDEEIKIHRVD